MNIQTTAANEPEVTCNHKPGDVWADGCCTSKKNKTATEGNHRADTPDVDTTGQTANSRKE